MVKQSYHHHHHHYPLSHLTHSKVIKNMYLPEQTESNFSLAQTNPHASEVLLGDSNLISELIHSLIRLFSDVQRIGMESSQYRKYIITIIRFMWNNPLCQNIVINMKNEQDVVQNFAQGLINSFSKLTDDALNLIPQIKDTVALMLTPEFSHMTENERDEKQLSLSQMENNVRYNFDLTYETLLLLLDAAKPWGVGILYFIYLISLFHLI